MTLERLMFHVEISDKKKEYIDDNNAGIYPHKSSLFSFYIR
uniref:Uncharacterized protein n=1 Tax=Yersinia enterocolitica W22703 TaxID=913028 RepID=F4MW90_YEREN|nr:unknown protein [Yersinia enterocolitica W22703]